MLYDKKNFLGVIVGQISKIDILKELTGILYLLLKFQEHGMESDKEVDERDRELVKRLTDAAKEQGRMENKTDAKDDSDKEFVESLVRTFVFYAHEG